MSKNVSSPKCSEVTFEYLIYYSGLNSLMILLNDIEELL